MDNKLSKSWVFMDEAIATLSSAFLTDTNVLLWGPGGHGKSELTLDFLESNGKKKGVDYTLIQLGPETRLEDIIGAFSVKKYMEDESIEYNFESGMLNFEYVILEEALDAPKAVMGALKQIITSGEFCQNSVCYKGKNKMIIICTNYDPIEWAENESHKAFIDRFPFRLEVKWDSYTAEKYSALFKARYKDEADELASYLECLHRNGKAISPRDAMLMYPTWKGEGLASLKNMFSTPPGIFQKAVREIDNVKELMKLRKTVEAYSKPIGAIQKVLETSNNVSSLIKAGSECAKALEHLRNTPTPEGDPETFTKYSHLVSTLKQLQKSLISKAMDCV